MGWFDSVDVGPMPTGAPSWLTDPSRYRSGGTGGYISGDAMTQGGPMNDPRWTNGTWGTGYLGDAEMPSDMNPEGSQQDPFAYTNGSLLTPWTREYAPPTPGGFGSVQMDPFNYQDFSYSGFRDPGTFEAGPEFSRPADFKFDAYKGADPFKYESYTAPEKFSFADFVAPDKFTGISEADLRADPSYQFRFDQGQGALQNTMAARGMLRSGAAAKALVDYGQNAASQEYGNVYARKASEADRNFGQAFTDYQARRQNAAENFDRNELNRLNAYRTNYDVASGTYDRNEANRLNAYRTNYDVAGGVYDRNFNSAFQTHNANFGNRLNAYRANADTALGAGRLGYEIAAGTYDRNRQNAQDRWNSAYSLESGRVGAANASANAARNAYIDQYEREQDNFFNNQDRQWSKLVTLASMGDPGGYAANMGNLVTGAGNARAAGTVGSANAWQGGLQNAGNAMMDWGTLYALNRRGPTTSTRNTGGVANPFPAGWYN